MNSVNEIISSATQEQALQTGNKSDQVGNLEKRKEKLRSEKVQGYYKLADGEQWIQTGHGKIAKKIPQKKESTQ